MRLFYIKKIIITFTVLLMQQQVSAKVDLKFIEGQVPQLIVDEDHVANLHEKSFLEFSHLFELQKIESDCTQELAENFTFNYKIKGKEFYWVWIKHSDPLRVNQVVVLNENGLKRDLKVGGTVTNYHKGNEDLNLSKDNFNIGLENKNLSLLQWDNQASVFNPETGKAEQKLITFQTGMELNYIGESQHRVVVDDFYKIKDFNLSTFVDKHYPFGSMSYFLFNIDDEVCSVVVKDKQQRSDYSTLVTNYMNQSESETLPYLWLSDVWSEKVKNTYLLTNFDNVDGVFIVLK